MLIEGLLSFTRGKWVRGLHILYSNTLISLLAVRKDFTVTITFMNDVSHSIDDVELIKSCTRLVSAIDGLIDVVESVLKLGHYTYFGTFTYDLYKYFKFKTHYMTLEVTPKAVKLTIGEVTKKFKGTKSGYKPSEILTTIGQLIELSHKLRTKPL